MAMKEKQGGSQAGGESDTRCLFKQGGQARPQVTTFPLSPG